LQFVSLQMARMNAGEFYLKLMVKSSNKTIQLEKVSSFDSDLIQYWKSQLKITEWVILCESISEDQVVDMLENDTNGHEFVGIAINFTEKKGVIYHTRPLYEDDIIHELLHVRFPAWSEDEVNFLTNLLMSRTEVTSTRANTGLVVNG